MEFLGDDWYRYCNWYHIYPIGLCGVPKTNKKELKSENKLRELAAPEWINHLKSLNIGGVYIGPVFESVAHGYDTTDLLLIDKRLGSNEDFKDLVAAYHSNEIKVIIDAVFNHVGRDFFAFNDIKNIGKDSKYCDWFKGLDFTTKSPKGDNFTYTPWEGYYELVTLNHKNQEVKKYLYDAVRFWFDEFKIDGLRLDAADQLPIDFWRDFREYCKTNFGPGFALMGEIIHGNYKIWVKPDPNANSYDNQNQPFDGITNYTLWDSIWKSHNNKNFDLLADTLSKQTDLLAGGWMYNFVDNHDVTRITSQVDNEDYLNTIIIILFTLQGSPSTYYGSEFRLKGVKGEGKKADFQLRPRFSLQDLEFFVSDTKDGFFALIKFLSCLRSHSVIGKLLTHGSYNKLLNTKTLFAFERRLKNQSLLVAVNSDSKPIEDLTINWKVENGDWRDLLHPTNSFSVSNRKIKINIPPNWGVIISSHVPDMSYKEYKVKKFSNLYSYVPNLENP
ncbi:alpha-amylase [Cryptosporidium felis]|nr:alpha-amylase [Cryptosporidium felis]